jgi:hypothetical protein
MPWASSIFLEIPSAHAPSFQPQLVILDIETPGLSPSATVVVRITDFREPQRLDGAGHRHLSSAPATSHPETRDD